MSTEELRQLAESWQANATCLRIAVQRVPYPEEHYLSYCASVYDACASQLLEVLDAAEVERVAAEQDDDLLDEEHIRILKNVEALLGGKRAT